MTNQYEGRRGRPADGVLTRNSARATSFDARPPVAATLGTDRSARSEEGVAFGGLLTNKLLRAMPGEEFTRLLPHLQPVFLSPFENIYGLGETARFAYFPEGAVICHLYLLEDGGTAEAAMIGREGMIGLSAVFDTPPPACLTHVVMGGSALRISVEVLRREFARSHTLQRLLLRYSGSRLEHVSWRVVCNSRHAAEARLCSWLLMISDRAGEDQLPLTHEQMARHLGIRRAGVTQVATSLRDRGAIGYSRGVITILDRSLIQAAACECYGIHTRSLSVVG
jgi:CRP-like cAMP-binding protein